MFTDGGSIKRNVSVEVYEQGNFKLKERIIMKKLARLFAFLLFIFAIGISSYNAVAQNRGASEMELFGGSLGSVSFPHLRHQSSLGDCNRCHNLFSQSAGAIQDQIKQGKLEKKQVMNHCKKCHKEMAETGKKTGPLKCKECHKKN